MDFLSHLLLESPIYLGVFSFILLAVMLFARRVMSETPARWAIPVTISVIILLFCLQKLVVTQRERIWEKLDTFIAAIEHHDSSVILNSLAESYSAESMDRAAICAFIENRLISIRVYDTRVAERDVVVNGDDAQMNLLVAATMSIQGGVGDRHLGRWSLGWRRDRGEWRIVSIVPRMLDMVQIGSLRELATGW